MSENNNQKNKKLDNLKTNINPKKIIIMILVISAIFITGTFAWLSWRSNDTSLVLTVGNITNVQVVLSPYQINATVTPVITYENETPTVVTATNNSSNLRKIKLYYKIDTIAPELVSSYFKYTITKSEDGGSTYTEYLSGDFSTVTNGSELYIMEEVLGANSEIKYKVYLWLDGSSEDQSSAQGKTANMELRAEIISDNLPNVPILDDSMIPIVFDTTGNNTIIKTISSADSNWYDYDNQEWANAILVTDSSRSTYKGTTGVTVNEEDILAYYVWIPRYKYQILPPSVATDEATTPQTIDIIFETTPVATSDKRNDSITNGTLIGSYRTHPAFWWDNDNDGIVDTGEILAGIWVGKFETSAGPSIIPNVSSLRNQNISEQFAIAYEFINYGIDGNTTNAHMIKNSEWGAVAYLSHSKYGVNREIYINNSSEYYTGRSGGNVGGSTQIKTVYTSQTSTVQYNTYGFYTWDGFLLEYNTNTKSTTRDLTKVASTTGNITGIYDMSGGAREHVMGYYGPASSIWGSTSSSNYAGFSSQLDSKYYDNYTTTNPLTACNSGICYGHGLSETGFWYNDTTRFISADNPWIWRGGLFSDYNAAGIFYYLGSYGIADTSIATRSVLVVR